MSGGAPAYKWRQEKTLDICWMTNVPLSSLISGAGEVWLSDPPS